MFVAVVRAKAGTQYSGACVLMLERISWLNDYWVPAFAGTTPSILATTLRIWNG
jgi:hypothetical protein